MHLPGLNHLCQSGPTRNQSVPGPFCHYEILHATAGSAVLEVPPLISMEPAQEREAAFCAQNLWLNCPGRMFRQPWMNYFSLSSHLVYSKHWYFCATVKITV